MFTRSLGVKASRKTGEKKYNSAEVCNEAPRGLTRSHEVPLLSLGLRSSDVSAEMAGGTGGTQVLCQPAEPGFITAHKVKGIYELLV